MAGVIAASLAASASPAAAQQELRYSLSPTAERVAWDGGLGLENSTLYGGRLGFLFGNYVELQGFYLRSQQTNTRFGESGFDLPGGQAFTDRAIDIDNYGANLVLNISATQLQPFIRVGGSILRFEPEGAARTSQIALRAGGGIRFGRPGQLRVQLFAEDLAFRVNRFRLAVPEGTGALPTDPDADELRHNLVYGAGVSIPLGGGAASFDDRPAFGLGGISLPVEIFGGVLNFDGDAGLEGQNLVGARTGLNFGPYIGLRGYYWRGVNDDFGGTAPIQSWGGEALFNLNTGPGLSPYVIAGAGQLDFTGGYEDEAGEAAQDRAVLILGGGVGVGLTDRLRLNLAARNHLFSDDRELEDVARADQLRSNWMLSAGIGFDLFGRRGARERPQVPVVARGATDTVWVNPATGDTIAAEQLMVRERAAMDPEAPTRDTVFVDPLSGERMSAEAARRMRADRAERMQREERAMRAVDTVERAAAHRDPGAGYVSGRTTTIQVPAEGEIYIRYGPGGDSTVRALPAARAGAATSPEETHAAIRAVIREELERQRLLEGAVAPAPASRVAPQGALAPRAQPVAPQTSQLDARAVEDRILARVDALVEARVQAERDALRATTRAGEVDPAFDAAREQRMLQEIERTVAAQVRLELDRQAASRPAPVVVTPAAPGALSVQQPRPPLRRYEPQAWSAYSGATLSASPQFVVGARVNLGPILSILPSLAFVPEVAVGVGGGATSTLLAGNAQYDFSRLDLQRLGVLQPYVGLGLGALYYSADVDGRDGLDLTLNPAYGAAWSLYGIGNPYDAPQLFIEHHGIGLFDVNRLNAGLRWPL